MTPLDDFWTACAVCGVAVFAVVVMLSVLRLLEILHAAFEAATQAEPDDDSPHLDLGQGDNRRKINLNEGERQ